MNKQCEMDAETAVGDFFNIPKCYIKSTNKKDLISLAVHQSWLKTLLRNHSLPEFTLHETLSSKEVEIWLKQGENLGQDWQQLFIRVLLKLEGKVIPLPRGRSGSARTDAPLSYTQLLHYVSQTNHKNLWKEGFKKYLAPYTLADQRNVPRISLVNCDIVMRDIITRMYGCPIIRIDRGSFADVPSVEKGKSYESHNNILPAVCAVETPECFMLIQKPHINYTLEDCVTFSPAMLTTSHAKPLFIVYQLLQVMRALHDRGLLLGNLTLKDILVMDNLWIQVLPQLEDNIYKEPKTDTKCDNFLLKNRDQTTENSTYSKRCYYCKLVFLPSAISHKISNIPHENEHSLLEGVLVCEQCFQSLKLTEQGKCSQIELEKLCKMWAYGCLSNFDYITALNKLAGRRFGDPTSHHVMPWVTDFFSRHGPNWRDLTRSKYRLNKGDRQLDLTYETAAGTSQVPHHVSDILSEITYYVYMSRRTPRSVLCKYVRSNWVPAEYPSSIQRLQEWTPDECIPEFFSDASVFKSIHSDLPDLELPSWALSEQDFIEKHREALESHHVSERLHHWIDLTFGYKLSGSAAVKSKNVCLHLVDSHMKLTNIGVVQLFSYPHPQRLTPSPYWGKAPPKIQPLPKEKKRVERLLEDEGHSSGVEEEDSSAQSQTRSSPLALSRLLSRSRGSLLAAHMTGSEETNVREKDRAAANQTTIILPKDYNPVAAIQSVESVHNFLSRTFHHHPVISKSEPSDMDNSSSYKQVVATRRIREMQVLGCLVVEMFLCQKLRPLGNSGDLPFEQRLAACHNILIRYSDSLPRCMRHAVSLLLQIDLPCSSSLYVEKCVADKLSFGPLQQGFTFRYPTVTSQGLPPPSAHQLLQPLLSSFVFPFPKQFPTMYSFLQKYHDFCSIIRELAFLNSINGNVNSETLAKISTFASKINHLKVVTSSNALLTLLPEIHSLSNESMQLILPYIKDLLNDPSTAILSAWQMFDIVSRVLGPKQTCKELLDPISKLYDYGTDSNEMNSVLLSEKKHLKLYHRKFLLQLIVRLGLSTFLENFITPLVEAVGGYRDYNPHTNGTHQRVDLRSKTANFKCSDVEDAPQIDTLSPLDEDSSGADSEQTKPSPAEDIKDEDKTEAQDLEPEVFEFESENTEKLSPPTEAEAPLYNLMDHLNLNLPQTFGDSEDNASLELQEEEPIEVECGEELEEQSPTDQLPSTPGDPDGEDETFLPQEDQRRRQVVQYKVSDMSAESIIWLSHRLGPVLTARYLSRNLLRMLTLCYVGKENLSPLTRQEFIQDPSVNLHYFSIAQSTIVGDENAAKVLDCLASITALYGEQFILLQYLPHMGELIALCKKKLTGNLEGVLVGCLVLLKHMIPFLSDAMLMDQLQDVILKTILNPTVRLISTTRVIFPSGASARRAIASKYLDALYILALRIGREMTKTHLTVPSLQRFFLVFSKAQGKKSEDNAGTAKSEVKREGVLGFGPKSGEENISLDINRDDALSEWPAKGSPLQISHARLLDSEFTDSYSPPPPPPFTGTEYESNCEQYQAMEELRWVFTPELAHMAYTSFMSFLKDGVMTQTLKNEDFIRELCCEYQLNLKHLSEVASSQKHQFEQQQKEKPVPGSGSFGTNVAIVGNRIDLQEVGSTTEIPTIVTNNTSNQSNPCDIMAIISRTMENTNRHLKGNWLAYWDHEIGRAIKDTRFNFKQMKLQMFAGHSNSIRAIYSLDNENSFMSGSRDKTVKLWSLRSQGDGSAVTSCQWTYTGHRKSILALTFLESLRIAASCDSVVHLWDPFIGSLVGQLDSPKYPPINVLQPLPAPSTCLLTATTDATVRIIDGRTCSFVNELKVSIIPSGIIRCMAIGSQDTCIAIGQSSGLLTLLDIRTGGVLASWKGHEGEVLQLVVANSNTVISSSLDQTISVWNVSDGKLLFNMRGPTEPAHCLSIYENELISGTTASRIGVHTAIDPNASFSSTRLRSETFKGVLTTMTVLPLNRLLLVGSDGGNITLLC